MKRNPVSLNAFFSKHNALADGAITFCQRGISVLTGLAASVLLARTLAPEHYGMFAVGLSLASLLALAAQNGMPTLLIREIATTSAKEQHSLTKHLITWCFGWTIMVALALIAVFILARSLLNMPLGLRVIIIATIVPAIAISRLCAGTLTGLRHHGPGQFPIMVAQPLLFVVALALIGWKTGSDHFDSPTLALGLRAGTEWIACAIAVTLLWAYLPSKVKNTSQATNQDDSHRRWRASLFPLGLLVAANAINLNADIQMLGVFRGNTEVGQYRVAVQIFTVAMSAFHIVGSVLAPRVAAAHAKGHWRRVRRQFLCASWIMTALSVGFATAFTALGSVGMPLVFGDAYEASYASAVVMVWGVAAASCLGPAVMTLNMLGAELQTARYALGCAGLNLALNAALIPWLGALGAAIATAVCLIVLNALVWRQVMIETSAVVSNQHNQLTIGAVS